MPLPPALALWVFPQVPQKGTPSSPLTPCRASLALCWFWAPTFGTEIVSVGGRSAKDQAYFLGSSDVYQSFAFVWHTALGTTKMVYVSATVLLSCYSCKHIRMKNWAEECYWLSHVCGWLQEKKINISESRNWEICTKFWSKKAMLPDWCCDGRCSWELCGALQNSALPISLSWIGLYPT